MAENGGSEEESEIHNSPQKREREGEGQRGRDARSSVGATWHNVRCCIFKTDREREMET